MLQSFLLDKTPNTDGRWREPLYKTTDVTLEKNQNVAHWLLPGNQTNGSQPHEPVIDDELAALLKTKTAWAKTIRTNCLAHANMYFRLWGFSMDPASRIVSKHPQMWNNRNYMWLHPKNHNFNLMTRLIRTLVITHHFSEALSFQRFLINTLSVEYPEATQSSHQTWNTCYEDVKKDYPG